MRRAAQPYRWLVVALAAGLATLGLASPALASRIPTEPVPNPPPGHSARGAVRGDPVTPGLSGRVRDLPKADPKRRPVAPPEGLGGAGPVTAPAEKPPPSVQSTPGRNVDALNDLSAPLVQFAGQASGAMPPDAVGDVGPNHYVQMVNTSFQIWNKQGTSLAGPTNINSLWTSNGVNDAECDNQNAGDPIVLYDQAADRWMLSQFTDIGTAPFYICIAYSQTADPTGAYHTYAFQLPRSHDYPKFGIWPDGLYMSTFEGSTLGAYVFDRSSMLNGAAATFQDLASISSGSQFRGQRLLPSDWDGTVGPLLGTPNYFVQSVDGAYDSTTDRLEVFEARVDWQNPANSSFVNVTDLPTLPFSIDTGCTDDDGDGQVRNCVPQAGTTMKVDALANRLMHRLQYRNFRTYEAMVTNQTIDAGSDRHAVRWYELRRAGGGPWMIYQQGTYAPGTAHRWMGSMAMDGRGDIALGYSLSDPTNNVFPSIAYTGRNVDAPRGLMPEPEFTLFSGANAQTGGDRWGDYSSMSVDPADDCTFWYTQEYGGSQQTRIGSFRFNSCGGTDLGVTISDAPDPVIAGGILEYHVTVRNKGPQAAANVVATVDLPAGVEFLASSLPCTGVDPKVCSLGQLPASATVTLTMQVRVRADVLSAPGVATTNLVATAVVTSDTKELSPADNTATTTTTVLDSADLAVTKTCKPDAPAPAGKTAFCEIFVDNLGPSDARDAVLTDVLTSDTSFTVSAVNLTAHTHNAGNCTPSAPIGPTTAVTLRCELGVEPAGGRTTIRVELVATEPGDINDVASVAASTPDPVAGNNSAKGRVSYTGVADLALTKAATPDPVSAGDNLTYTLTVHNAGPSTAHAVALRDTVPAGVSPVSVASPPGTTCVGGTPGNPADPLACALGNLGPGATAVVTVVVRVASNLAAGTVLVNQASVVSDTADPNNANNIAGRSVTVQTRADLAITKTSDKDTYGPLAHVTWTITVRNNGPSDAQAVTVTDQLPDDLAYISNTGGCTKADDDILTCQFGTVRAGATMTFTVREKTGLVRRPTKVTNTASVASSTTDPVPGNNTAAKDVTVTLL